ncbi:MAG: hypothetical protein LBJ76_03430 [Candidatus Accumulibacter sp.]|jgi:hypothetical protein|nr:hypothetical protein [Accumulibacter sp.]
MRPEPLSLNFIRLRASRLLFILLAFVHLLALFSIVVLPWPVWARAILSALAGFSAFYAMRPSEIEEIIFPFGEARMKVRIRGLDPCEVSPQSGSAVFPKLIVLKLRFDGERAVRYLSLLPDQMSTEEFRRLSLWLRWNSLSFSQDA